ncbi:ferredoxin [Mycobacterium sp. E796]|uniref:ferredoxin n=1 Tax=Mycobacterium sp. E796 TaxID=1834151 RepID=UPI0007FDBEAE|nr:ferredoxin [Mycobacterium sp. E796]OBI51982.1 ferredoxin [Mycobacterium sp. E796]
MRLTLHQSRCAGHALCYAVDPELFPIDDSGYSAVHDREIGPDQEPRARQGVQSCPEVALAIEED